MERFWRCRFDRYHQRKKGELGPIEKKWGVDIELKEAEYDPCLAMYGAGQCDAVCITNMDILQPSLGRPGVMVLPTSTSFGADACIVTSDIKTVEDLKGVKVTASKNLFPSIASFVIWNCLSKRRRTIRFPTWTRLLQRWPCNKKLPLRINYSIHFVAFTA